MYGIAHDHESQGVVLHVPRRQFDRPFNVDNGPHVLGLRHRRIVHGRDVDRDSGHTAVGYPVVCRVRESVRSKIVGVRAIDGVGTPSAQHSVRRVCDDPAEVVVAVRVRDIEHQVRGCVFGNVDRHVVRGGRGVGLSRQGDGHEDPLGHVAVRSAAAIFQGDAPDHVDNVVCTLQRIRIVGAGNEARAQSRKWTHHRPRPVYMIAENAIVRRLRPAQRDVGCTGNLGSQLRRGGHRMEPQRGITHQGNVPPTGPGPSTVVRPDPILGPHGRIANGRARSHMMDVPIRNAGPAARQPVTLRRQWCAKKVVLDIPVPKIAPKQHHEDSTRILLSEIGGGADVIRAREGAPPATIGPKTALNVSSGPTLPDNVRRPE